MSKWLQQNTAGAGKEKAKGGNKKGATVVSMKQPKREWHKHERPEKDGVKDPRFRRMGERVGIGRFSGDTFDWMRPENDKFLKPIIKKALLYMHHGKRKTL